MAWASSKTQHQLQRPMWVQVQCWFLLGGLQTLKMQLQSILARLTRICKCITSETPKLHSQGWPAMQCHTEVLSKQKLKPAHFQRTGQLSHRSPQACCWLFPAWWAGTDGRTYFASQCLLFQGCQIQDYFRALWNISELLKLRHFKFFPFFPVFSLFFSSFFFSFL